jgi:Na+-driven multidrug efflux pump
MIVPVTLGVLTRISASFGPATVAAYGVATRIEFFALAVLAALSSVIGPFVGQNWGARQYLRARSGVRLSERFCLVWGIGLCLLLQAAARPIATVFNPDPDIVHGIVLYLRIVPWMFGFQGILLVLSNVLNVLERPLQAAAVIFAQMFLFCVPLAFLGAHLWGVGGVFSAIAAAYALGGAAAHVLVRKALGSPLPASQTP